MTRPFRIAAIAIVAAFALLAVARVAADILLPVAITVDESVTVTDAPGAFPPAVISVGESVTLTDAPGAFPPAVITVNESVTVADSPGIFPPVAIIINETVAVTDAPGVFPPVAIVVNESIAVADVPVVAIAPLTVISIAPASGAANSTISVTNLAGMGFMPGATAKLARAGAWDVAGYDVTVVGPQKMTLTFDLTGVPLGAWDVVVTNPGGQSARLAGGFTVTSIPPVVATAAATNVTTNSARLNGSVSSIGTAYSVNVFFEYGATPAYGSTTYTINLRSTGAFGVTLWGLAPGATYYYRAVADGGDHGISYGDPMSLTVGTTPPAVATRSADNIQRNEATLRGELTSMGTAGSVVLSFEYGATDSYGHTIAAVELAFPDVFSTRLILLTPGATYHYRAKADGGIHGVSYGADMMFTTSSTPPTVATNAATSVGQTTATFNGNLSVLGTATAVNVSFEYGTSTSYGSATPLWEKMSTGTFSQSVIGLTPGTMYYVRAKADGGSQGVSYGDPVTFTTAAAATAPVVVTVQATDVSSSSAKLHGNLASMGGASSVTVRFEYGTTGSYGTLTSAQVRTGTGSFTADITGLSSNTTYHFRAKADGGGAGASNGADVTFKTGIIFPPDVVTSAATSVTGSSATLNGNVLSSMGPDVYYSFEYGLTTSYGSVTPTQHAFGTGTISYPISGLSPGKTYHFRARAKGFEFDPAWNTGFDVVFTTAISPPSVTTVRVDTIGATTANVFGNLTSMGTASSVSVFFEYGPVATGYNSVTTAIPRTSTGSFSATLTGLTAGTTYRFRTKADGGAHGSAYGSEMTFTTLGVYSLTIARSGSGTVTPAVGVHSYSTGAVVNLTASPAAGWQFGGWTGDVATVADPSSAGTTVTMNGSYSIAATFVQAYVLTVNAVGGGSTSPVAGAHTYPEGDVVALVAAPDPGWQFEGWSGHVSDTSPSIQITMNSNKDVTATFSRILCTLTVAGETGGTVTGPGVGAFTYPIGDVVQLVAVPNPGYRFSGWTGDTSTVADASAASTTVTMAHNIALTAGFALAAPPVTTADIDLVVGLNLVTLPLTPATPFTAVSLIADVALQGGTVTQLDVWDETTGMWQSYKPGTGTLDFPLQLGRGAFLKVTVGTTWRVTGTALTSGVPINLVTGLNLVGIPYSTTLLTASSLLAGIAAQGGNVTQLDMWDESTGMWKSYKPGTGTPNFDIVNWRGYFLKSTATSTYTP